MEITFFKLLVFAVCIMIGYYGMKKKSLDFSGFISAIILGALLLYILPLTMWFIPMLMLLVAGSVSTKYMRNYKAKRGVAEDYRGRSFKNVLGNGGAALIFVLLFAIYQNEIFLYAYICSIASACADTMATELGQLSRKKPVLMTTLEPVPTGTTGAISLFGEFAAMGGSFLIAAIPFFYFGIFGFWNIKLFLIVLVTGFIGCQIDSFIGAAFELKDERRKKGFFNNHTTNFLSCFAAALVGMAFYMLWI